MRVTRQLSVHFSIQPFAAFGEMGYNGGELRTWKYGDMQQRGTLIRRYPLSYTAWDLHKPGTGNASDVGKQATWGVSPAPITPHRKAWPTLLGPTKDSDPNYGSVTTAEFVQAIEAVFVRMSNLELSPVVTGVSPVNFPNLPTEWGGSKNVSIDTGALAADERFVKEWEEYQKAWSKQAEYYVSNTAPVGGGRSSVSVTMNPGPAHSVTVSMQVVCTDTADPTAVWHLIDSVRQTNALNTARADLRAHLEQIDGFLSDANSGVTPAALPVWNKPASLDSPFLVNADWEALNSVWSSALLARSRLNADRNNVASSLAAIKSEYDVATDDEARDIARLLGAGASPEQLKSALNDFEGAKEGAWVFDAYFASLSPDQKSSLQSLFDALSEEEKGGRTLLEWLSDTAWPALKDGIGWAADNTVSALKDLVAKTGDIVQDWGPTGTLGFLGGYKVLQSDSVSGFLDKWGLPVAVGVGLILLLK